MDTTVENAKRDGIRIQSRKEGSQSGGSIRRVDGWTTTTLVFDAGTDKDGKPKLVEVPLRYDILLNETTGKEARYATVARELARLYCGHLGTPNQKWWPDRRGLDLSTREFEAESVAYLVCGRLGIVNPSENYLADYVGNNSEVPNISIDAVMKSAGLIEQTGTTDTLSVVHAANATVSASCCIASGSPSPRRRRRFVFGLRRDGIRRIGRRFLLDQDLDPNRRGGGGLRVESRPVLCRKFPGSWIPTRGRADDTPPGAVSRRNGGKGKEIPSGGWQAGQGSLAS